MRKFVLHAGIWRDTIGHRIALSGCAVAKHAVIASLDEAQATTIVPTSTVTAQLACERSGLRGSFQAQDMQILPGDAYDVRLARSFQHRKRRDGSVLN